MHYPSLNWSENVDELVGKFLDAHAGQGVKG